MRVIAGEWRGRRLRSVSGRDVRPTTDRVREAWMSALGPALPESRVLDLFAGSGALGIEALSRGAATCDFVERSRRAADVIRSNLEIVGAGDRGRVLVRDARRFVDGLDRDSYDIALADPPYGKGLADALVRGFLARPFARELWVEHRTGELADLPGTTGRRYGDTTLTHLRAPDDQQ